MDRVPCGQLRMKAKLSGVLFCLQSRFRSLLNRLVSDAASRISGMLKMPGQNKFNIPTLAMQA
jgi:hypothetical protein